MSSGSKRIKCPTLTKGTRLSATRRRICLGDVASHSARMSISRSRRCVGDAGPGRLVSVLAWSFPDSGSPVSNGDKDADDIAHTVDRGGPVRGGASRDQHKLVSDARWWRARPPYGICSPVTSRRRASSSFRSRRISLRLGRPLGCSKRSSNRANHWAQLRASYEPYPSVRPRFLDR